MITPRRSDQRRHTREPALERWATFAGDDNAVQDVQVERFDGTSWSPLALSEKSPGFRIFTYSAFACLLVHLRMVGAECGVKLQDTLATFELVAAGRNRELARNILYDGCAQKMDEILAHPGEKRNREGRIEEDESL